SSYRGDAGRPTVWRRASPRPLQPATRWVMRGSPMSAAETPRPDGSFFSAFRPGPKPRRAWLLPMVSAVLALIAVTVPLYCRSRPVPGSYQVATPRGLRTISPGMSESQVGAVLGVPFLSERKGAEVCL